MLSDKRHTDRFWQESFYAALTGLTMAGAAAMSSARQAFASEQGDVHGDGALVTAGGRMPLSFPLADDEPLASAEEEPDDDDGVSSFHRSLVEEAAGIADAAFAMRRNAAQQRSAGGDSPFSDPTRPVPTGPQAGRRPVSAIGVVPREKGRS